MATSIELRAYKLKKLPVVPIKDAILFIKDTNDTVVKTYVTNENGTPFPLIDLIGDSFVIGDGGIQIKDTTSPENTISVNYTDTEIQIDIEESLLNLINGAIQQGENISELFNDANYITLGDLPTEFPPEAHTHVISDVTGLQTALDGKVDENGAITGATKTKITYDSKGLVINGADATTADINDSINRRYVTDANLTVINNTSNTNTGDETTSSILTKIGNGSVIDSNYLSYASQVEAEANTENTKVMTALRVFQNWLKNVTDYVHASLPTTSKTILGAISELFNNKLDKNAAITGATKTKVTYDSKGLVTSGADATTADIADSVNKRYQTDNQNTFNDATSSIQTQLNTLGVAQDTIIIGSNTTITTNEPTTAGYSQAGRNILIKNAAFTVNIQCLGGQPRTYQKGVGSTGAITFIAGTSPLRTLVPVSGTAVLNGAAGSIASLTSDGTTDYLIITNL